MTIDTSRIITAEQKAADQRAQNIAAIKAAAGVVITARLPEWRQRNLLARQLELQDKLLAAGSLTTAEQSEADAMRTEWEWCKAVRTTSDQAESNNTPVDQVVWP